MRKYMIILLGLLLFIGCSPKNQNYLQVNQIRLAPPQVVVEDVFFDAATSIKVLPTQAGTSIRYTANGTLPDLNSAVYDQPIKVTDGAIYKFISVSDQFIDSELVEVQLFARRNIDTKSIQTSEPSESYPGSKYNLFDGKKGTFDFRNEAWKGFENGEATISVWLEDEQEVNGIVVSSLVDHKSWIFGPEEIKLTYTYAEGEDIEYSNTFPGINTNTGKARMEFGKIMTEKSKPVKISVHIKGPEHIPSWHPGVGKKPWLFLDEIIIL